MYESPIDITMTPINTIVEEVCDELDGRISKEIITATRGFCVNVNEYELIKALNYDRNQYEKGYVDAKASIIHCKDCKYKDEGIDEDGIPFLKCLHGRSYGGTRINDFCSWAEGSEE